MAAELRLLRTPPQGPDEDLVRLLREQLSNAEAGQLRGMVCLLEYDEGIQYGQAGTFNEFEMVGHMTTLSHWLIEGEDED